MDSASLAAEIVKAVQPYLGVLVSAGVGAAGKDMWTGVKEIWAHLGPKMTENAELQTAAQDLVASPNDEDSVAAFRKAVRKSLEQDHRFTEAMQPLFHGVQSGRDTYIGNNVKGSGHIGPK